MITSNIPEPTSTRGPDRDNRSHITCWVGPDGRGVALSVLRSTSGWYSACIGQVSITHDAQNGWTSQEFSPLDDTRWRIEATPRYSAKRLGEINDATLTNLEQVLRTHQRGDLVAILCQVAGPYAWALSDASESADPDGAPIDEGVAPSRSEAVAAGLAALDLARTAADLVPAGPTRHHSQAPIDAYAMEFCAVFAHTDGTRLALYAEPVGPDDEAGAGAAVAG